MSDTGFVEVLFRLGNMAESRELDNTAHLERIRRYCYLLATTLGLPLRQVEQISNASLLHDIGKFSLPDTIIKKAGKYEQHEWEEVQKHTVVGASLLKNSSDQTLQLAEAIAMSHHERWDGSGYPSGLKMEEIPLAARICAVADVYDALTTKRVYKKLVPPEEALALITESGGVLFDPNLARKFGDVYSEIEKGRKMVSK